ncbi:hypothetical protein MAPG_03815 [Magnaporthiopsis poae ATCC 64411]|uniref:Protein-tyrosine phosphatase 2 n=1 Tax=Magnaporthiopsis poae (strain ATCC 64411 / 73-15) TaxID=644358 RepID=A0A0C4DV16_MAGP6|nr:hypothetical protein MAPG_03815 [Magnaporthiopsis poae ATCC 64411]
MDAMLQPGLRQGRLNLRSQTAGDTSCSWERPDRELDNEKARVGSVRRYPPKLGGLAMFQKSTRQTSTNPTVPLAPTNLGVALILPRAFRSPYLCHHWPGSPSNAISRRFELIRRSRLRGAGNVQAIAPPNYRNLFYLNKVGKSLARRPSDKPVLTPHRTTTHPTYPEMERFSKFRRSKKDSAGATGVTADDISAAAPASSRTSRRDRHSPFRNLHLRTSTKRARSSPPAALPQSPTSASAHPGLFINTDIGGTDQSQNSSASPLTAVQHPFSAITPKRQDFSRQQRSRSQSRARKRQPGSGAGTPQIPSFLNLSPQEIENKFQDLTWLERDRMLQSAQNPAPTFQFARVPSQPHVKRLDRYVNVQPWQNNRVRLRVPPGKPDYINASPICLSTTTGGASDLSRGGVEEDHPSRYIAMQGPKRNSVEHVWRMVFEQLRSPAVIVMLTETHEGLAEKCYPYFPRSPDSPPIEIGASDEFADGFRASVRCEAIEHCAGDAIELRKLVIRVHRRAAALAAAVAPGTPLRKQRPHLSNGDGGSRRRGDVDPEPSSPIETTQEDGGDVMIMSPFKPDAPAGRSIFPGLKKRRDRSQNRQGSSRSSSTTSARTGGDGTPAESTDREEADIEEEDETEMAEEVEERVVHHFLYKKWPDFGVPALEDLDSFFALMRLSREKNADPENPRIVHCSAGVGRSGTFIALEHLMRELDSGVLENWDDQAEERAYAGDAGTPGERDLIFHTVNQLREQRRNMVQAEGQFLFIYQVLRKLWQDKYDVPEEEQEPAAKRHEVDPFVSNGR